VPVKTLLWSRNLSSESENIRSELAETRTLTVKQHCCFKVQATIAETSVGKEVLGPVIIIAVLLLLPEKRRYPKLGA
jgi:hypothetical protein